MKLNKNGYSIVEMFAVIFLTSLIIFPLITTLVNNIEINDREQNRLAASSIAQGTLDSLNRITFADIETLVTAANSGGSYYVELNYDNCDTQLTVSADISLCQNLFQSIWNNVTFSSTEYRVFIVNYNLPQNYHDSLALNNSLPQAVKDTIADYPVNNASNPVLYRVIVWIEYDTEQSRVVVAKGLLSDE